MKRGIVCLVLFLCCIVFMGEIAPGYSVVRYNTSATYVVWNTTSQEEFIGSNVANTTSYTLLIGGGGGGGSGGIGTTARIVNVNITSYAGGGGSGGIGIVDKDTGRALHVVDKQATIPEEYQIPPEGPNNPVGFMLISFTLALILLGLFYIRMMLKGVRESMHDIRNTLTQEPDASGEIVAKTRWDSLEQK